MTHYDHGVFMKGRLTNLNMSWILSRLKRGIMPSNRFQLSFMSNVKIYTRCDAQSMCAKSARNVIEKLINMHEQNKVGFRDIMEMLDVCDNPEKPDQSERYISQQGCNTLALLVVEEAILQFEEQFRSRDTSDTMREAIFESLEELIMRLKHYRNDNKSEGLRIFILKFQGRGVEYLKELSQIKDVDVVLEKRIHSFL